MNNNRAEFQVGENDKSVSYPFPHHLPPFLHEVGQTAATHVSVSCQEKQLKIKHVPAVVVFLVCAGIVCPPSLAVFAGSGHYRWSCLGWLCALYN